MTLAELLDAFAKRSALDGGFKEDDDGVYNVVMNDAVVSLLEIPDRQLILLWGSVGTMPKEGAPALMKEMLKANFLGKVLAQGALSLAEDGRTIYLHQVCSANDLDSNQFTQLLLDFYRILVDWQSLVEDYEVEVLQGLLKSREDDRLQEGSEAQPFDPSSSLRV